MSEVIKSIEEKDAYDMNLLTGYVEHAIELFDWAKMLPMFYNEKAYMSLRVKINSIKSQLQDMLAQVKIPNESKSINDAETEKRERSELLRLINKYGIPEEALNP